MGGAAFREMLQRRDRFQLRLLLRPTPRNRKDFSRFESDAGVEIVWGDLTCYEDVWQAVCGADYVLHPAAMISPAADHRPQQAAATNIGAAENLTRAIAAQPNGADHIKFVNVGSVAQYGDRLGPIHMVRVGDPLKSSIFDVYATTKIKAERIVIESGLKNWVSLRQTYIAIPNALSLMDPISFHQPIDTRIELITARDAGYLLAQCCEPDVPDGFWCNVYNIGGGPNCRVVYLDYIDQMMKRLGIGDYRKVMERNWFCLRNFHCSWFEDSHELENYLHFQRDTLDDHYRQVEQAAPGYLKVARLPGIRHLIPRWFVKRWVMRPMAFGKNGPCYWIDQNLQGRISAFFGSRQDWESIPDWTVHTPDMDPPATRLDHGYDESKPVAELDLDDMRSAADFRGGECLSEKTEAGDMSTKLDWQCAFGHPFKASPRLVLSAGHWCPQCAAPPWNYDEIARCNPFFAQVWYPNHSQQESHFYDEHCYEDILKKCVGPLHVSISLIERRWRDAGPS